MGAGSTKASILKFQGRTVKDVGKFNKTIQEVQVVGSGWDRTLGGDALNAVIVDDMIAQFVASPAAKSVAPTVEAVQGHGRAAAKLWKEAERLRQILSANQNTQSGFEGLYEDIDFRYKITREAFEKLTESHAARVGATMQRLWTSLDSKSQTSTRLFSTAELFGPHLFRRSLRNSLETQTRSAPTSTQMRQLCLEPDLEVLG